MNSFKKLLLILSVFFLIILGGFFILLVVTNRQNDDNNSKSNVNRITEQGLDFNNFGVSFNFPKDYFYRIERENLPAENEMNIYLINNKDKNATSPFYVQVSVYKNSENLSIADKLNSLKDEGILIFPAMISTDVFEDYGISPIDIGDNHFIQYTHKQTSERTALIVAPETLISIQEFGISEGTKLVYDQILKTLGIE